MGNRKQPTPPPDVRLKPSPPPAPPASSNPNTKVREFGRKEKPGTFSSKVSASAASCYIYSDFSDLTCWLCHTFIPRGTEHRCGT